MKTLSQNSIELFDGTQYTGPGTYILGQGGDQSVNTFAAFISSAIGLITLIGIIWFVFIFITGAVGIITSGGDKNSNESARKKITSGIIGLIVTFFGILIVRFIGKIFGLDLLDFADMFGTLIIK